MSDTEPKAKGIEFFDVAEVPPMPVPDPADPYAGVQMIYKSDDDKHVFETIAPQILGYQRNTFVLFPEMPLSMIVSEFGPNYPLPTHSHAEDCMYYIERGSLVMGARSLRAGEGFLVRGNQPYSYTAGPEGVRVLEIRHQPMAPPNLTLHQKDLRNWTKKYFEVIGEPLPAAVSPS